MKRPMNNQHNEPWWYNIIGGIMIAAFFAAFFGVAYAIGQAMFWLVGQMLPNGPKNAQAFLGAILLTSLFGGLIGMFSPAKNRR